MSNVEYSLLSDWYIESRFITCDVDVVTPTISNTFHIKQTAERILKLCVLLYHMPFIFGMILTILMGVP